MINDQSKGKAFGYNPEEEWKLDFMRKKYS